MVLNLLFAICCVALRGERRRKKTGPTFASLKSVIVPYLRFRPTQKSLDSHAKEGKSVAATEVDIVPLFFLWLSLLTAERKKQHDLTIGRKQRGEGKWMLPPTCLTNFSIEFATPLFNKNKVTYYQNFDLITCLFFISLCFFSCEASGLNINGAFILNLTRQWRCQERSADSTLNVFVFIITFLHEDDRDFNDK